MFLLLLLLRLCLLQVRAGIAIFSHVEFLSAPRERFRKLSDFLTREQYEEAMQQFKVLCETRLGYVWRVAQHDEKPSAEAELPGVCYLNFNGLTGQWEPNFV